MIILATVISTFFLSGLVAFQAVAAPKVIVDNDRVNVQEVVWDAQNSGAKHTLDTLTIALTGQVGKVAFEPKGSAHVGEIGGRSIVIALKDHPVAPLANKSGLPNAFPRPGSKKQFENNRIVVWDYSWTPGQPSPIHFHDKDVVVVYLENGALKSTTQDGKSVVNDISFGLTKFNPRDRSHTEEVVKGKARAVMMELK